MFGTVGNHDYRDSVVRGGLGPKLCQISAARLLFS